jgi:DNA repair protein RadD
MTDRRKYQEEAVRHLITALPRHRRVIAVAPTGAGKTVVAAMLLKAEPRWRRVLFLAHTYELVDQARARLADLGIAAGVIMAGDEVRHGDAHTLPSARVQVASVQTATVRGVEFEPDLIVFDEAHRTMAASYLAIAEAHPSAEVLGLTATPRRIDGKGLADFYHHLHVIAQPSELYRLGYLAKPTVYSAPDHVMRLVRAGLKGAARSAGDYTGEGAARAVDKRPLIGNLVSEAKRLAPKVPKVVFCCTVAHSQRVARAFCRAGVKAVHIDGETPAAIRDQAIADLRDGRIEAICNVNVLTEGWDLPVLGAVIIARPTKSLTRLLQMAGRVQRPREGKRPVILDHGASVLALRCIPGQDIDWQLDPSKGDGGDGTPVVIVCGDCLACIPGGCGTCPHCGAEQPKSKEQEKAELEAKLVEVKAERFAKVLSIAEDYARKVGAPDGWAEKLAKAVT